MDGTPTSRLNDWLLRSLATNKIPLGNATPRALSALPTPKEITFKLPGQVLNTIAESITYHKTIMDTHELAVLEYAGVGSSIIKTFKISPDSYTQLVMALAYYKMKGVIAPVYESAQTRKYKLGRTEVIRSATTEALDWVKSMEEPTKSDVERLTLLQKAGAVHAQLAKEAADGKGVDRHLFGEFSIHYSLDCQFSLGILSDFSYFNRCRSQEIIKSRRIFTFNLLRSHFRSIFKLDLIDISINFRIL